MGYLISREIKKQNRKNNMTKLAVSLRKSAQMLFGAGFTFDEVNAQLHKFNQPSKGYVYLEDVTQVING